MFNIKRCFGQEKDVTDPYVAVCLDTTRIITTSVRKSILQSIINHFEIFCEISLRNFGITVFLNKNSVKSSNVFYCKLIFFFNKNFVNTQNLNLSFLFFACKCNEFVNDTQIALFVQKFREVDFLVNSFHEKGFQVVIQNMSFLYLHCTVWKR